jgi:hypothetical protein
MGTDIQAAFAQTIKKTRLIVPEFQAFGMVITYQFAVVTGNLKQRKNLSIFGSVFVNIEKTHCFDSVLGEWLDQSSRHGRLFLAGFVLVKCAI